MGAGEALNLIVNILSLGAIALSAYVFLTDQFRRWLFFGYKPTAIVIAVDMLTNKVLLLKKGSAGNIKLDHQWHFPQGGIYSSDLNDAVSNILNREFKLEPNMYDFHKTIVVGTRKIKERKIYRKYHFGSFSLTPTLKGKGYVACIVYMNLININKRVKLGYGVSGIRTVSFAQALELIEPYKAVLLRRVSKQILDD